MSKNRQHLLPIFACMMLLVVGCADDGMQQLGVEMEGYGSSKVVMQGAGATWADEEALLVNSTTATIERSDGRACISAIPSADVYRAVYPATLCGGAVLADQVEVSLPAVYHYAVNAAGDQLIELPMAARSTGGSLFFRHITGGIYFTIVNSTSSTLVLDSLSAESSSYSLSGRRTIDIANIQGHGSAVPQQPSDRRVAIVFDRHEVVLAPDDTIVVMLPIAPVGADNLFTIRATGHEQGVRYTTVRTQSTAGAIVRNELAYARIAISGAPQRLFSGDPCQLSSGYEFWLMQQAIQNKWAPPSGNIYRMSSYVLTDDIDMEGREITPICAYTGETFDGAGHTVSNFTVLDLNTTSYRDKCGLFAVIDSARTTTIKDLNISHATIRYNNAAFGSEIHVGALVGYATNCIIDGCHVSDITFDVTCGGDSFWGGILGAVGKPMGVNSTDKKVVIRNCQFSSSSNLSGLTTAVRMGGIIGKMMSGETGKPPVKAELYDCTVQYDNMTFSSEKVVTIGGLLGYMGPYTNFKTSGSSVYADLNISAKYVNFGSMIGQALSNTSCVVEYAGRASGSVVATADAAASHLHYAIGQLTSNSVTDKGFANDGLTITFNGVVGEKD